jgi:hypothetical protein
MFVMPPPDSVSAAQLSRHCFRPIRPARQKAKFVVAQNTDFRGVGFLMSQQIRPGWRINIKSDFQVRYYRHSSSNLDFASSDQAKALPELATLGYVRLPLRARSKRLLNTVALISPFETPQVP